MIDITILYNNRAGGTLRPGFGFSAFIRTEGATVLFDAGADSMVFEENAAALGVPLKSVVALVVSHDHCDHMGAIDSAFHKGLDLYVPKAVSKRYESTGRDGIRFHAVKSSVDVVPGVRSTGQLGKAIPEQALLLAGDDGPVLISGCAHMGIERLVRHAMKLTGEPMDLVLGGFHLLDKSTEEVERTIEVLDGLGIHRIAPCHCTGDSAITAFQKAFGERFVRVEVGTKLSV